MSDCLFTFNQVSVEFHVEKRKQKALNNISFSAAPSESIGLVGESGSGKTTLARILVGLVRPSAGSAHIGKFDCSHKAHLKDIRKSVQMLFQDPESSLNPRRSIYWHLAEALKLHFPNLNHINIDSRIDELIESVQLPKTILNRYPYELSGGQKQRAALARALAPEPKLLILDEPLASLDIPLRKQILSLLSELKKQRQIGFLFITHDLSTLTYLADTVAVLHEGNLVELGPTESIIHTPSSTYTKSLMDAIPTLKPKRKPLL